MSAKKEKGRIVHPGMGGFLNPPTHPEHDWHVETDLRRRSHNRGGMSLTAATKASWLDDATRAEARALLKTWQPPPPDSPEIIDWRQQVLEYFRSMYRNPGAAAGEEWNASAMLIDRDRDPIENADDHAGVHLIRKYYPDYKPTEADFGNAYWGSKPEGAAVRTGGRGARMRARSDDRPIGMTYGTVPPFEKFEHDVHTRVDPDKGDGEVYWPPGTEYPMELVNSRKIELAEEFGGLESFTPRRYGHKSGFRGNERQIYDFIKFLMDQDDAYSGEEGSPGDLASSIMTTLGYEWI